MKIFAKPPVALGFAAFFFCGLLCTHLDDVTTAPLGLGGDLLAGIALLVGGILSGRDWERGRQYQLVGWSFMAACYSIPFSAICPTSLPTQPTAEHPGSLRSRRWLIRLSKVRC